MLFDQLCNEQPNLSVLRRHEQQQVNKRENTVTGRNTSIAIRSKHVT